MNDLRLFGQWLWSRPFVERFHLRLPIPLVVSRLFFDVLLVLIGYKGVKAFVSPSEKEAFESVSHNGWILLSLGLFFCALITEDYLNKKFPSAKSGFWAQFNPGKRDYRDPIVRLELCLGIICLITLMIGMLQTIAKR